MLWRQGDVFVARCRQIPADAVRRAECVLAEGELTGHRHRVRDPYAAALYEHAGTLYLEVMYAEATIEHEEHGPITLARGAYRVWRQREFVVPAQRTRSAIRRNYAYVLD